MPPTNDQSASAEPKPLLQRLMTELAEVNLDDLTTAFMRKLPFAKRDEVILLVLNDEEQRLLRLAKQKEVALAPHCATNRKLALMDAARSIFDPTYQGQSARELEFMRSHSEAHAEVKLLKNMLETSLECRFGLNRDEFDDYDFRRDSNGNLIVVGVNKDEESSDDDVVVITLGAAFGGEQLLPEEALFGHRGGPQGASLPALFGGSSRGFPGRDAFAGLGGDALGRGGRGRLITLLDQLMKK